MRLGSEICLENLVNSGEPSQEAILIQAPKGEGATTIPQGSRLEAQPKRQTPVRVVIWSDLRR